MLIFNVHKAKLNQNSSCSLESPGSRAGTKRRAFSSLLNLQMTDFRGKRCVKSPHLLLLSFTFISGAAWGFYFEGWVCRKQDFERVLFLSEALNALTGSLVDFIWVFVLLILGLFCSLWMLAAKCLHSFSLVTYWWTDSKNERKRQNSFFSFLQNASRFSVCVSFLRSLFFPAQTIAGKRNI